MPADSWSIRTELERDRDWEWDWDRNKWWTYMVNLQVNFRATLMCHYGPSPGPDPIAVWKDRYNIG